ncbi:hypothetical protein JCM30566_04740 [Marinitoga arctica]
MKKVSASIQYYFYFSITMFLIFIIILINFNTEYDFDPDFIKNLPWNKRSMYIKQKELISKLRDKKYYNDKDFVLINQLINISKELKDEKTLEFANSIKFSYILYDLKYSEFYNLDFIDFKSKLGLFLLSGNADYLESIIKNVDQKEKIIILLLIDKFYPEIIDSVIKYFTEDEINILKKINSIIIGE